MPAALNWESYALYAGVGLIAGMLAGLLGVGGGLVIVPALLFLFHSQQFEPAVVMHLAVATSLATIVFTSVSSASAHYRRGAILWRPLGWLVPGILLGGVAGAAVAGLLPGDVLRVVFGVFVCLVAWQIARGFAPATRPQPPAPLLYLSAGGAIGALSAVLGIGGGSFVVPFLAWTGVDMRRSVGTSSACGLPIALAGGGGLVLAGWGRPDLPPFSTGYVYWPAALWIACTSVLAAPLGAALAHSLPVQMLRRIFAVFLLLVGIRLLV